MNVEAFAEGFAQLRDVGNMSQHPELDLAVVGADELRSGRCDKGGSDLAALVGAHRNVLKIGIGRGQPAGRGGGHGIARMHPAGFGMGVAQQRVGVGRAQLGELTPLKHPPGKVEPAGGKVVERIGIGAPGAGGGLAAARQLHPAKKYIPKLLRRPDVETLTGEQEDLLLKLGGGGGELRRKPRQNRAVDKDAFLLHGGKHGGKGALQRFVDRELRLGDELGPEQHP